VGVVARVKITVLVEGDDVPGGAPVRVTFPNVKIPTEDPTLRGVLGLRIDPEYTPVDILPIEPGYTIEAPRMIAAVVEFGFRAELGPLPEFDDTPGREFAYVWERLPREGA
jgi:hypothetical protein